MRILYLMFSYTVGGTERLVTDICNNMVYKSNEVYIYIVNDLVDNVMIQELDSKVHVKILGRQVGGNEKLKTLIDIADYIKKNQIGVVHCNALNTPELLLVAKLINPKIKVFYTIHGMSQYKQLSRIKVAYRNILCNKIIAISKSVREDIISAGAAISKVEIIYNAVDFNRLKYNKKEEHIFDKNNVVIGNIARFLPKIKGQDVLVESAIQLIKRYPHIKCFFAGEPDKEHKQQYDKCKAFVSEKYQDNILFVGNVEDIAAFLKKIDIFVLPSRFEGFGISLVEAMGMEVPCIASRLAGPEEILEYGKRGVLFEPGNKDALMEAIEKVIQNYSVEKQRAMKNSAYVREKYTIDNMTNQLLDIYRGA